MDSVVLNPEKKLVYVTGKVDPTELMKKFSKWGKKAQLLSYDKEAMNEEKHVEGELKIAQIRKEKKNSSCRSQETDEHYCGHNDFGHEPESYVPPKELDISTICRDPFCKIHVRNAVIKNAPAVLPRRNGTAMWPHPHMNGDGGGIGGYPPPAVLDPGYGYPRMPPYQQRYPRIAPPAIHYYNLRRPMPGFDYFSDEHSGGCSII